MKNQPSFRTTLLAVASCLSLGFASCSTTKQISPSSTDPHPKPINNNSSVRDLTEHVADQTLLGIATATQVAGMAAITPIAFIGGGLLTLDAAANSLCDSVLPE